jgi:hypothetical protein
MRYPWLLVCPRLVRLDKQLEWRGSDIALLAKQDEKMPRSAYLPGSTDARQDKQISRNVHDVAEDNIFEDTT